MSRYVVANWKSHKTPAEAGQWLSRFLKLYKPQTGVKVILAPAFPFLVPLQQMLAEAKSGVELASQDISAFPLGSYTGAVAAAMIQDLVGYSLVGHSERRRWFRETDQEVANKVHEALAVGITPIICVDQPYMRSQFAALADQEVKQCLVGYGPVEAIGLDMPPAPERIQEAISQLHILAPDSPILYGGAVHGENAADYMQIPGLSGLMVATASLDPEKFVEICQQVAAS
ncbi:MAG: triose-phosphate isomerase family protein [Desulfurivibrionaceae bacterium]|nr:triose-phosphate isomerase family protein [Desulfurivibrionaceae bacterium]